MARLDRLAWSMGCAARRAPSAESSPTSCSKRRRTEDVGFAPASDGWWTPSSSISGGTPPAATYRFKHALIQETAYKSCSSLFAARATVRRVQEAADADLQDVVSAHPELLTQHSRATEQIQSGDSGSGSAPHDSALSSIFQLRSHRPCDPWPRTSRNSARATESDVDGGYLQLVLGPARSLCRGSQACRRDGRPRREVGAAASAPALGQLFPALSGLANAREGDHGDVRESANAGGGRNRSTR